MTFLQSHVPSQPVWLRRLLQHGDVPYQAIITLSSLLLLGLMVGVGVMLWLYSGPTRATAGLSFITSKDWNPVGQVFGAAPFILGTLNTSLIALVVAVPLGLMIAIFLSELCPVQLRTVVGFMVELLAAIPSVVYGAWGIFVFIPAFVQPVGNFSDEHPGHTRQVSVPAHLSRPVLWRKQPWPPG